MTRRNVFVVLTGLLTLLGSAEASGQGNVEITVNNIKSTAGELRIALFDQQNFVSEKEIVQGKIVKPIKGSVTVVLENVRPGIYGLKVLHDENGNGVLDRSKMGIPKEGFAFGNNAMGKKGPPTFDKARVEIADNPVRQVLTMKYF